MSKVLRYGSHGDDVKWLQCCLNENDFFTLRRKLVVDGRMGTLTCSAVQQAKYWLGYPRLCIRPVAGLPVMEYLSGRRLPPATYRLRIERRAASRPNTDPQTKMRCHALAIIKGELGTTEAGGHSNIIRYNTWWGWGAVAYCAIGLSWAWVQSGSTAFRRGVRWASTVTMLADAKAGRNGLHLTSDPDPGCPGLIDFDGHTYPNHAITFVRDHADGTCETYEFNTTGADGMEGVWRKDRPLRNCWWMVVER